MSTHPNAILQLTLTPDDLSRKTFRAIAEEVKAEISEDGFRLKIGEHSYSAQVLEEDYDESFQVGGKEGDILVTNLLTYGYGEQKAWDDLVAQQAALAEWAKGICERHKCAAAYCVTANYW